LYGPGRVIVTLAILAAVVIFALFRMIRGPAVYQVVLALFVFSAFGAVAFLLGRAHARQRRERKRDEP
jgi:multisubunit Na+/H+ antiporter MnhF subunit